MPTRDHIVTLRLSAGGCRYDVRVNDVPVFQDLEHGHPMTASMLVNESIAPGANALSIRMLPPPGESALVEDSRVEAVLTIRPHTRPKGDDVALTTLSLRGGRPRPEDAVADSTPPGGTSWGSVGAADAAPLPPAGLAARRTVSFALPAHAWRWLSSDRIPDDDATRRELERRYSRIRDLLAEGRTDWIPTTMRERHQEMALALFEAPEAVEAANGLFAAARDPGLSLHPLELPDAEMQVFGDGRLARLVRWDGRPLIVFVARDGSGADYFPITFRRQGADWILCR
ncbi:hypothetical protein HL658_22345 [Azospirillum sp. RWY-5-1]|uniref:Uncharacterized protein n=1 Tax=Azospirillum oleiclasticum TaxID=2735135 RepID=A0ABX2TF23_9PROT|nr:hypothetical protein [Azospirillum oleiclasticum]NYZ15289.1 hypothetical protein [Azospirillum oleiclasticum]NYZ21290.1 hypothetical protein [Azospirillum oleiclasticum]